MYPSITKRTLDKCIEWAKSHPGVKIFEAEEKLIYHCRHSILSFQSKEFEKKEDAAFDVTEGSYEGAEIAELIGLMILHTIANEEKLIPVECIGIYRDDGLIVVQMCRRDQDALRKKLIKLFKEKFELDISISIGLRVVDFLDVSFNLNNGTYRTFNKPDSTPIYVNKMSNHPPTTIRQIPKMVNKRLCKTSSSSQVFNESKQTFQNALQKAKYNHILEWRSPENNTSNRIRRRKAIWYNIPWSNTVKSKIGKEFLTLIDKWFVSNPFLKRNSIE